MFTVVSSVRAERLQFRGSAEPERFECPSLPPKPVVPQPGEEPMEPLTLDEISDLQQEGGTAVRDLSFEQAPAVFGQGRSWRMAIWGDSHAAARFFSDALADGLGFATPSWRPSFLPPAMGMSGVRMPVRKSCLGGPWKRSFAHRVAPGSPPFGRSLIRLVSEGEGSYAWLDFRGGNSPEGLRTLDVVFSRPEIGAQNRAVIAVSVNDSPEQLVSVDRELDRVLQLQSESMLMTLRMRLVSGNLALDGFVPFYARDTGLVLDTFGIPGATAKGWTQLDPSQWSEVTESGEYDVVFLEYGTNEGAAADYHAARYESDLRAAVQNLRKVYPHAACILIGPTDRGVIRRKSGKKKHRIDRAEAARLLHYSRIHRSITEVQQRVGRESACITWDWQAAMGGAGGAYRWLAQSPRLMASDLIHLTAEGYRFSGRKLAARLLASTGGVQRP